MSSRELTSKYDSPLDIPYMKKLIFSLNIIGCWPITGKQSMCTYYRNAKIFYIVWVISELSGWSYLKKNVKILSFVDQGRLYINLFMGILGLQRFTVPWGKLYKMTVKDFLYKIHLYHHKNINDFSDKTYYEVEKISNAVCNLLHLELYTGVVLYNFTPLYNSYIRGMFNEIKPINATYDQSIFYDVPFDYTTNFSGWLIVYMYNILFSYDIASIFCMFDLLLVIISFHLWGHIKILKYNLINFPRPVMKGRCLNTSPWYNEEESLLVTNLLKKSITHYNLIKEYMNNISNTYGNSIGYYYLFLQISGCILLVEFSQMSPESFLTYGMLTVTLFQQLIQMSVTFELIGSQSDTIKDAVYEVPWECMNIKNRKLVLIYLTMVQEPLHIKALGMVPVGVQTMASILKTSMSYFMLLRTTTNGD